MILINDILKLHEASIDDFGGAKGVRDLGHLESAIARPFQTFGGENLYKTAYEMAAALGESLIINHPLWMVIKELVTGYFVIIIRK